MENPDGNGEADAFWDFSTALYARSGVEAALLALQDVDGLEINLVLFCLFAGGRGQSLDGASVAAMQGVGYIWGREVVRPLRAARRQLKPLSENGTAAALREEVKKVELAAEKAMQAALAELLTPAGEGGRLVAEANLAALIMAEGLAMTPANAGALGTVLDAAFGSG
ncbi:MAG: TIGR02444 family protein [Parvibaculum sp.]|uniref:TIGR02444 family protein n=1 Tax=Parvibaculum sp. TaxID=2024848 RepID=UPI0025E2A0BF|nr:TIGR02444 family protein [Parvibaculum sp.]MCE9648772.1 TIGR02444 family protein [Parvibaculum sp.]